MKLILLSSDDCDICDEAEAKFKKDFWRELDSGEAKIVNLDQDEEFQEVFITNELPLAPIVLIMTDRNKIVAHIDSKDFFEGLKEASPADEADKAAVESSGDSKS